MDIEVKFPSSEKTAETWGCRLASGHGEPEVLAKKEKESQKISFSCA